MRSFKSLLMFQPCKGITKHGKPCQAVETWSNGYCKWHGGAGISPDEVRRQMFEEKLRRAKEQAARHRKRLIARIRKSGNMQLAAMLESRTSK
jgi:hypothetical protein